MSQAELLFKIDRKDNFGILPENAILPDFTKHYDLKIRNSFQAGKEYGKVFFKHSKANSERKFKEWVERPSKSPIIKAIVQRIKRGLNANIITIGQSGFGKSYVNLRIAEEVTRLIHKKKLVDVENLVADSIEDAFRIVELTKERGMPLILDEIGVLASARRGMSMENVSFNALLDMIRKKGMVLMMNSPHIKGVDVHILRMSHFQIECYKIDKAKKQNYAKIYKLFAPQRKTDVLTVRLKDSNGYEIDEHIFNKPNDELCASYEAFKDKFFKEKVNLMRARASKKRERVEKELEGFGLNPSQRTVAEDITKP